MPKNYLPHNAVIPPATLADLTPPKPDDIARSASPEAHAPAARTNIGPLAAPLVVPAGFAAIDSGSDAETIPPGFVPVAPSGDATAGSWGLDAFGVPIGG